MNHIDDFEKRVRDFVADEGHRVRIPSNLEAQVIQAIAHYQPRSRPRLLSELALTSGLVIFVGLAAWGFAAARSASHRTPPSVQRTSAASLKPSRVVTSPVVGGTSLVSQVDWLTTQVGWVVLASTVDNGERQLLMTSDGGRTWTTRFKWSGSAYMARSGLPRLNVQFTDDRDGFVLDPQSADQGPALVRTQDGGASWRVFPLPGRPGPGSPLSFVDSQNGWLLGDVQGAMGQSSATIFRTRDGGLHWSAVAHVGSGETSANGLQSEGDKDSLRFTDPAQGWLTAYSLTGLPLIWMTRDGGLTWQDQRLEAPPGLYLDGNAAPSLPTAFGQGTVVLPVEVALQPGPYGQTQTTPAGGYPTVVYLYRSTDGGGHWTAPERLPAVGSDQYPLYWQFIDTIHWVVGSGDQIWTTHNGGHDWQRMPVQGLNALVIREVDFVNAATGWAIGAVSSSPGDYPTKTQLLHTTDGGADWVEVALPVGS